MSIFWLASGLLVVALYGSIFLRAAFKNAIFGFGLALAAYMGESLFDLPTIDVLGLNVHLTDPLYILLGLAGAARFITGRVPRRGSRKSLLFLFGILFLLGLTRGLLTDSSELEFRGHFLLLCTGLYGASFTWRPVMSARAGRLLLIAAGALSFVAAVTWLLRSAMMASQGRFGLDASATLLIAQALIILTASWIRGNTSISRITLLGVLGGTVLLLQHRTVWIATAFALLIMLIRNPSKIHRITLAGIGAVTIVGIVALAEIDPSRTQFAQGDVFNSLRAAATDQRTWEWRVQRWLAAIETHHERGLAAVVFGAGYGQPWVLAGPQAERTEPPHNFYLEVYIRFGLIGLIVITLLFGSVIIKLWHRGRTSLQIDREVMLAIIIMQLVYYVAYSPTGLQPLLLGIGIGLSTGETRGVYGNSDPTNATQMLPTHKTTHLVRID